MRKEKKLAGYNGRLKYMAELRPVIRNGYNNRPQSRYLLYSDGELVIKHHCYKTEIVRELVPVSYDIIEFMQLYFQTDRIRTEVSQLYEWYGNTEQFWQAVLNMQINLPEDYKLRLKNWLHKSSAAAVCQQNCQQQLAAYDEYCTLYIDEILNRTGEPYRLNYLLKAPDFAETDGVKILPEYLALYKNTVSGKNELPLIVLPDLKQQRQLVKQVKKLCERVERMREARQMEITEFAEYVRLLLEHTVWAE